MLSPDRGSILVVGNDSKERSSLRKELEARSNVVTTADRGDEALTHIAQKPFDLIITDSELGGMTGVELLERVHVTKPELAVILVTEQINSTEAIAASRYGALEYFQKPVDISKLLEAAARATDRKQTLTITARNGHAVSSMPHMIGRGRAMQNLYKEIGRAAACSAPVLICGATGTGKELVAKAIHQSGSRAKHPFLPVNCAAIPETLFEAELFGHEMGAFTGALKRRVGFFEHAQRGTIFLDEIGELSSPPQAKLLRVLEDKALRRVGGNERIPLDVRVLAATNRDLQAGMQSKQFRQDLFYRLGTLVIQVPDLTQRTEDIPDLVAWFLHRSKNEASVENPSITPEALRFLVNHTWHGNVRELESVVRRALLQARHRPVGIGHVREACEQLRKPANPSTADREDSLTDLLERAQAGEIDNVRDKVVEQAERKLLARAMEYARGNQAKVARWLGMTRTTIRKKLRHFAPRPTKPPPCTTQSVPVKVWNLNPPPDDLTMI
jgi:DNA-binding NtrC family response regulator